MADIDVPEVLKQLETSGFAVAKGDPSRVTFAFAVARALRGTTQARGRKINSLVPLRPEAAPPRSLSAVYGLGRQPLHTDGAHLPDPPDIIVLSCEDTSETPTIVWKRPDWMPEFVRHGIFTVRGNGQSFIAPAVDQGRLRFDPVCMSPADGFAKEAVYYFESQREEAHVHEWSSPGLLLFIDNRNSLHAREAVLTQAEESTRRVDRLAFNFEVEK